MHHHDPVEYRFRRVRPQARLLLHTRLLLHALYNFMIGGIIIHDMIISCTGIITLWSFYR